MLWPGRTRVGFRWQGALLVWALVALFGCGSEDRSVDTRAVVIGIDGADWKIIDALAAEGDLPNLSRLRERGVWGPIETLRDVPLSPVIWTSVATGKKPGQARHHLVPGGPARRQPRAGAQPQPQNPVGDLEHAGGTGACERATVGWWASYPAEDVGEGVIVSRMPSAFHGFGQHCPGGRRRF